MSWKDRLLPASFRGVPFFVDSSEYETGRRLEVHNLSGPDEAPYVEDLGPDLDTFSITGYIIQPKADDDYFEQRDNLIAAVKQFGTGKLVHPYYGVKIVAPITRVRFSETIAEGGIARFSISFAEVKEKQVPVRTSDNISKIDSTSESSNNYASDNFGDRYQSSGTFQTQSQNVFATILTSYMGAMNSIQSLTTEITAKSISVVSNALANLDNIIDSPCDLANTFLGAANQFKNILGFGEEVITGGIVGLCSSTVRGVQNYINEEALEEIYGVSGINEITTIIDSDPTSGGFISDEQEDNVAAARDMSDVFLCTVVSEIAIRTNFDSQESLLFYMNKIADKMSDVLDRLGTQEDKNNNDIYTAIEDMRNELVKELLDKSTSLRKTVLYNVGPGVKSALALAYDLYQDLDRMEDIQDRNKPNIVHPGFLPAGYSINVLDA